MLSKQASKLESATAATWPAPTLLPPHRCKTTCYAAHLYYEEVNEVLDHTQNGHCKQGKFEHQSLFL